MPPWETLDQRDLSGLFLPEASLPRATLTHTDLTGAVLPYADLRGACMFDARLDYADLRGANLSAIGWKVPGWRDRYGAMGPPDPSAADLHSASLVVADLRDANLSGVDLTNADLRGALLQGADLGEAVMRDALLQGAQLDRAKLWRADLRGADLRGVVDWERARWADAWLYGAALPRGLARVAERKGANMDDRESSPVVCGSKGCGPSRRCAGFRNASVTHDL